MADTLSPLAAHNAVAAVVDLQRAIISDYERTQKLLQDELARQREMLEKQIGEWRALASSLQRQLDEARADLSKHPAGAVPDA